MENPAISPKSGRMEAVHLVHFLDSFLDLPGVAALPLELLELLELFQSFKRDQNTRRRDRKNFRPRIYFRVLALAISSRAFLALLARAISRAPL